MSAPVDLSEMLRAIEQGHAVADLDVLAGSLSVLGPTCAFHGRQILTALEPVPIQYNALIWNLLQALDKLERGLA